MDQDAFIETYKGMNARICLFEKGILSGHCKCSRASKLLLAEREGIHCDSDDAQQQCESLVKLLRHHARFTIKTSSETSTLPHGKAMRIQIGGLRGLHRTLYPDQHPPALIEDIHALVCHARDCFHGLEQLPFQEIIKQIAAFRLRKRRSSE